MSEKVTAGRDYLGGFAPEFAAFNDDILFGKVWAKEDNLSPKMRSMITIAALMGAGITDQSLTGHLETGKKNGITKGEIVDLITQLAFYIGWPKGWAVFAQAMEIYKDDENEKTPDALFGPGKQIADTEHFNGPVYVKDILDFEYPMIADSVTFAPGVRNNWHIHQAGQILLVTDGEGWYQEEGKQAQRLKAGDVVKIPGGAKHWHGAAKNSWFTHVALEDWSKGQPEWLERVSDEQYDGLETEEK